MSTLVPKYISIAAALSLLALSASALVAPTASAADMLEGPGQQTTEVEYGTGWYLRGDIAATTSSDYFSSETSEDSGIAGNQNIEFAEGDSTLTYGVGFGYRFTDSIRGDLGYRYMGSGESSSTITGITPIKPCANTFTRDYITDQFGNAISVITGGRTIENCTQVSESSYNLQAIMANAYYDFDTPLWGVRPFVGAGIGVIRNQFTNVVGSITCTPLNFEQCNPTDGGAPEMGEEYTELGDRLSGTSYHLAGAFHAGFAVPITKDVYFDTSYTYTRMAEEASFGGIAGLDAAKIPSDFHSLRLGLRVEIW